MRLAFEQVHSSLVRERLKKLQQQLPASSYLEWWEDHDRCRHSSAYTTNGIATETTQQMIKVAT